MYGIADPYVTSGIQSVMATGLEWYSVDSDVANTVAAPLASAISLIVPLPFIDRFAGKLSASIKEYNVVSSKTKLNNFLSVETKDFIAKVNNGNAYSKKSEHSTLFFSKKVQIDDVVIQAYKDRAIDLTAYKNGYIQNVLEHAEQDKSITYNTLIYDANDTRITKAIEHKVLRQEAIDAAIKEQATAHALSELQSKNLLGIEVSKGDVANKVAVMKQAKVVAFSHEMKMTGTDGKHIVVNKTVDDVVNIDKVSAESIINITETTSSTGTNLNDIVGKNNAKSSGKSDAEKSNSEHGAPKVWSTKARIKAAQLPTTGKIRYIPPPGYKPSNPLPKNHETQGIRDKFGNVWTKGSSRTTGEFFEWDVQLSDLGRKKLGWASRDGKHLNVSLKGRITHE